MDKLPDYLIESYIIPYLSSYDLFYKFRTLSSYYYYCARNKILTHFPGEMMKILKKIIDFNTKEDLTKNFDLITKKTFNEKRELMIFTLHINISLVIKKVLETTKDESVFKNKSLVQIKTNPISFPGLSNIVVKNATTKEEGHLIFVLYSEHL